MILFPLYNRCPVCSEPTKLKPDPFGLHIRLDFSVQKSDHIDLVGNVTKDLGYRGSIGISRKNAQKCLKCCKFAKYCKNTKK